jgi:hypothetical protein
MSDSHDPSRMRLREDAAQRRVDGGVCLCASPAGTDPRAGDWGRESLIPRRSLPPRKRRDQNSASSALPIGFYA